MVTQSLPFTSQVDEYEKASDDKTPFVLKRTRKHDVAFPSRRDRQDGRLAGSVGQDYQLGDHGSRGNALDLAIYAHLSPWGVAVRHAVDPSPALDRGQAVSIF